MRKLLLSTLALAAAFAVNAQGISGVGISPAGATADQQITITVIPAGTCQDGTAGLAGAQIIRLHSGIKIGVGASSFDSEVSASPVVPGGGGGADNSVVGFTQQPDGSWTKTFVPRDYYTNEATGGGAQLNPGDDITGMGFVLNGGPDGNNWDLRGKNTDNNCGDYLVAFPIAGAIVANKAINTVFTPSYCAPSPVTGVSKIVFSLNRESNATVRLSNVLGQTVKVLADGTLAAGKHSFSISASELDGGIYFYTIEAGGFSETKKVLVTK